MFLQIACLGKYKFVFRILCYYLRKLEGLWFFPFVCSFCSLKRRRRKCRCFGYGNTLNQSMEACNIVMLNSFTLFPLPLLTIALQNSSMISKRSSFFSQNSTILHIFLYPDSRCSQCPLACLDAPFFLLAFISLFYLFVSCWHIYFIEMFGKHCYKNGAKSKQCAVVMSEWMQSFLLNLQSLWSCLDAVVNSGMESLLWYIHSFYVMKVFIFHSFIFGRFWTYTLCQVWSMSFWEQNFSWF